MATTSNHYILEDLSNILSMMSKDENKIALKCAERVKDHLQKALSRTGDEKYARNLKVVEGIIQEHKKQINHESFISPGLFAL